MIYGGYDSPDHPGVLTPDNTSPIDLVAEQRQTNALHQHLIYRLDQLLSLMQDFLDHQLREPEVWQIGISASKPLFIDRRGFTNLYIFSHVALNFIVQDISGQAGTAFGNFAVTAETWVALPFQTGDRLNCPTIASGSEVVVALRGQNHGIA